MGVHCATWDYVGPRSAGTRQLDAVRTTYVHHPAPPPVATALWGALPNHPLQGWALHFHPRQTFFPDTLHPEFAGVHAASFSATPSLVPVNLVRSSGVPAPTGHYLVDMLPRDSLSSETEIFVANGYQNIPLSGLTDLEPGDLPGTSSSPLMQISVSALQGLPTASPPTSVDTDVLALHDKPPVHDDGTPPADPPKTPNRKLLERLTADQRTGFLRLWDRLPLHLRDVSFDLRGSGWSPLVITALGGILCEYPDVFSTSTTDFGSRSLIPFKISIPLDSAPVVSRPYRINPVLAKQADAVLDQYLSAGLIQHSASPYASPMVAIPKRDGNV